MFVQPLLLSLKSIPLQSMRNTYWQCQFLYFFHNTGPFFAQSLPQDHTHFPFLLVINEICLTNSISINNFNCNPVVLKKKIGKTSKNCHFWVQIAQKKWSVWATVKAKNQFICRNNKR